MPQKINLVIVVLDGSYLLEEHFETIFEAYLEPILKHMKQQQIIIEKEDKEKKGEIEKNKITPRLKCGLVVFGNYEPISRSPVTTYYFEENLSQFEKLITGIEFEDGGMRENAVAEGLVAALEMFDAHKSQMKAETPETAEVSRHCLLISNSHPCPDLVHRNLDEKYDQYSMKQIVEEMKKQKIYLSLISPERSFTELEELVAEVNQDVEVHNATDVINLSHVVKLAGFKPPFTHPKEVPTAQKRKREDSTSSTGTSDQQVSSAQNLGNDAKKVKIEQTQEHVKDQPPIPNGQLPAQQPHLQAISFKKDQTATVQNLSEQHKPSSHPPVVNTVTSLQATPKLQTSAVSTATTSNTIPTPSQVMQIPPSVLPQTQSVKLTNQAAPNNATAVQMQSALNGTIYRPSQRPAFALQQAMSARPQMKQLPYYHAQLHAHLSAMTPERRTQFIQAQQRRQLLQQGTLLQAELANQQSIANVLARGHPQLNLGLPLQNGTQLNTGQQQIGNFVTSAAPISEAVSTQALNGFASSAALNVAASAQQLGAFNVSAAPTSNSSSTVGYSTASTSVETVNSAQLPASTIMNSISAAGMNNVATQAVNVTTGVIGQMATSINGGIRSNLPQKKINALWSGHIAWSANNNQGQKRELTCQVSAFPVPTKKIATAPISQIDYMVSYWPEKMEISGINHAKDVVNNVSNHKIVSFLPNPTNPQENNNTFGVLMRILDGRKMAAFVRFPNAPNPNGGIVLFTNNGPGNAPKLVGLLFLETPLPTSASVISQGQQIRPPQSQQSQALQLQFLQQMAAIRNQQQQQQQQQQQPAMQIQATAAVLQQRKLLQQQQQITTSLQPNNVQQILQQRQVIQPNVLNSIYRLPTSRNTSSTLSPQQISALFSQQRTRSQQQPTQ